MDKPDSSVDFLSIHKLKQKICPKNLVTQRTIVNHVKDHGGLTSMEVSKEEKKSPGRRGEETKSSLFSEKCKQKSTEGEINDLKSKKRRLESDISKLFKSADMEAERAECLSDLTALAKSNVM